MGKGVKGGEKRGREGVRRRGDRKGREEERKGDGRGR